MFDSSKQRLLHIGIASHMDQTEKVKAPLEGETTITIQDLERKLAATTFLSTLSSSDEPDPTQFLSINLLPPGNQDPSENYSQSKKAPAPNLTTDSELPAAFQDIDTEDLSATAAEYFTAAATDTADKEFDSNFEPEPFDHNSDRIEIESEVEVDSLLDPKDYEHVFDEAYLQDIIGIDSTSSAEGRDSEEPLDLIQAFDNFGLGLGLGLDNDEDEDKGITKTDPQALSAADTTLEFQEIGQQLGQPLYCLPCRDEKEVVFDIDLNSFALENLDSLTLENLEVEKAELDFIQGDNNFTEEELQDLLQHVMQEEHERTAQDSAPETDQQVMYEVSKRPEALTRAEPLVNHFYGKNEKQCFGHKDTIFGLSMSPCGRYCATASQDSSICVWNIKKHRLLSTLKGSSDHECLRVAWASGRWGTGNGKNRFERSRDDLILAMAGADGVASIWQSKDGAYSWKKVGSVNHVVGKEKKESNITGTTAEKLSSIVEEEGGKEPEKDEDNGTEIYSLQFIDKWHGLPSFASPDDINASESLGILMTSSEDFIHIWQYYPDSESHDSNSNDDAQFNVRKVMDIKFTHMEHGYGGVFVHLDDGSKDYPEWTKAQASNIVVDRKAFGGDRNPDNLVYVFDAVQCPANNLLGVALSDGTTRLVNGRGVCVTILQVPGCQSHLTSLSWDKTGSRIASCVATGHVVLWDIDHGDATGVVQPTCRAVLEGGHSVGRPLFGAAFFGGGNEVSNHLFMIQ